MRLRTKLLACVALIACETSMARPAMAQTVRITPNRAYIKWGLPKDILKWADWKIVFRVPSRLPKSRTDYKRTWWPLLFSDKARKAFETAWSHGTYDYPKDYRSVGNGWDEMTFTIGYRAREASGYGHKEVDLAQFVRDFALEIRWPITALAAARFAGTSEVVPLYSGEDILLFAWYGADIYHPGPVSSGPYRLGDVWDVLIGGTEIDLNPLHDY